MSRSKRQRRKKRKRTGADQPLFSDMQQPTTPPKQVVLRTAQEVAQHLGVSLRAVQNWMDGGMREFCTPANKGQQDGRFPIDEIKAWRRKVKSSVVGDSSADPEIEKKNKELKELALLEKRFDLRKKIGGVIDLDEAVRMSARSAVAIKTRLQELKGRLESILPQELDDDLRHQYLTDVEDLLYEIYESIGTEFLELAKDAETKQNELLAT